MRITLDLLQQAPQSLNPANQRQLMLRGLKIPATENLGCTNDAYECIDFSDNDLIKLGNFPLLNRLKVMLLTNNRISRIAEDCFDTLPNLVSITLTGNKLERLVDLAPLTKLKHLERLSLLENPVTKVKHYRPYMINKCGKHLRILDFSRIKDKERKAAGLLFAGERGRKLLEEIAPPRVVKDQAGEKAPAEAVRVGPSPEVIERIKKAIAEAETIEEVTRLEKALKSGVLPDDLKGPAIPEATSIEEALVAREGKPNNEKVVEVKDVKMAEDKKEEPTNTEKPKLAAMMEVDDDDVDDIIVQGKRGVAADSTEKKSDAAKKDAVMEVESDEDLE